MRQSKRQVPKEMFHKWQWTYTRGSISLWLWPQWWLCAEIDDQDKSFVSMLWCIVCWQYETRICGPKNSRPWIDGSSNHKTNNRITDHPNSEPHKVDMMYFCTFHMFLYILYVIIVQCISMKCVRSTFCDGRSSYIVVWQSSGCYQILIFLPVMYIMHVHIPTDTVLDSLWPTTFLAATNTL